MVSPERIRCILIPISAAGIPLRATTPSPWTTALRMRPPPRLFLSLEYFAAPRKPNQLATLVGGECSGTNGHDIGVDPVHNQVFVGVRQLADPASLSSGTPGVLVWHDPSPVAQPRLVEVSAANS